MKVNLKLTDNNINKAIKTMRIIIDSRESNNDNIINYFNKKKIPYVIRKLDFGDYSAEILKNDEIGLPFDVSLEKRVVIELKHSGENHNGLEELSGNFTNDRTRFENEFIRSQKEYGIQVYLVVGNGSWDGIKNHNYRSLLNENAFYNSLLSWERKYNLKIHFVSEENIGEHIYKVLGTNLKKILEE